MASATHTLSRADYSDLDVWEAERERIFHGSWMLALRSDVVPPGSRTTVNLAGESVIITCDHDGALHAFANVCRHRGAKLCERDDIDHRTAITCPYHAWSYALDGRLVATPHLSDSDVDKATLPLWQYHLRVWNGFVFVSLAADPPNFDEWLHREFAELVALERWGFEHLVVARTSWVTVAANWKIVMENYQECLHCTKVHPELVDIVPLYRTGWTWDHSRPQGGVVLARGHSFSDREVALPLLPGLSDDDAVSYFGGSGFPNCFIDVTGTSAIVSILYPTSPTTTVLRTDFLFHPNTVNSDGFDPTPIVEFSDLVTAQDNGVCEAVQRGVTSRAFDHGVLTPKDDHVIEFVRRYRRHMGATGA